MRTAVLFLFLACSIACSTQANTNTNTNVTSNANLPMSTTNTVTVTAPVVPESQAATTSTNGSFTTFTDGSQIVGRDIQPGTYRTRAGSQGCTWSRLGGFSGAASDVLASVRAQGAAIVTIKPTDKGFQSQNCGLWTSDTSKITTASDAPFGDGTYIVGTDIAAGTWKAQQPQSCYWARLKGFSGDTDDIIANQNGVGVVTIEGSDKGFSTSGCGSWSKVK